MKRVILTSVLTLVAAPVVAQSSGTTGTATTPAPAPSSMGRWNEYRERQEKMRRVEDLREAGNNVASVNTKTVQMTPKQQVINAFAQCAWTQVPDRVRTALATPIGTPAEREALRVVAGYDACSDRPFISGRSGEFRGGLAEAGIHGDADRKARIAALVAQPPVRVAIDKGRPFVASFAQCIAAANPAGSLALLNTEVGSPAEKDAMLAMPDALSGCMPEGASYRVDVRDVRNHIADALYRMSGVPGA